MRPTPLRRARLSLLFVLGLMLVGACLGVCKSAYAIAQAQTVQQPLTLGAYPKEINLLPYVEYLADPGKSLSFEDIQQYGNSLTWHTTDQFHNTINFGYTDAVYWFRFQLRNETSRFMEPTLIIGYPVLDYVELFLLRPDAETQLIELGDKRPFDERMVRHRNFIVPVTLSPAEALTVYIRVETSSSLQLPLWLTGNEALLESVELEMLGLGLYFGMMLVMILYNLFVYSSVRESNYLYYVMYVAAISVFFASLNGLAYQYIWPNSTWWNDQSLVFSLGCVVLFASLFTYRFLRIPTRLPRLHHTAKIIVGISLFFIGASLFVDYHYLIAPLIVWATSCVIIAVGVGIYSWVSGDSAAKYYLIAWATLLAGALVLALNKLDLIARNVFTENAMQVGSVVEVILLSLALADRFNVEKRRRYIAQIKALDNERVARIAQAEALLQEKNARQAQERALSHEREAREAQAEALNIQLQATEQLEVTVKNRTRDLENANRRLEELTLTDGLTGARNRRFLNQCLEREFDRAIRERAPLSVLLIDVDHFKAFNDTYGHLAGDDCLREVVDAISSCAVRENDVVARYGGEEFCVVLPGTDAEGALQVAEDIRRAIAQRVVHVKGEPLTITASIGVTSATPQRNSKLNEFFAATDVALYRSKANGRNQVTYNPPPGAREPGRHATALLSPPDSQADKKRHAPESDNVEA